MEWWKRGDYVSLFLSLVLFYLICIVFFITWGQCTKTWSSMILEMTETIILSVHVIRSRKICTWCWGDLIATGCLCQTDVGCAYLRVHFVPSFTDGKVVGWPIWTWNSTFRHFPPQLISISKNYVAFRLISSVPSHLLPCFRIEINGGRHRSHFVAKLIVDSL